MEISFINALEAENIKYGKSENRARETDRHQQRLNNLAQERARKNEQKNAKETAAEERRRQAEEVNINKKTSCVPMCSNFI